MYIFILIVLICTPFIVLVSWMFVLRMKSLREFHKALEERNTKLVEKHIAEQKRRLDRAIAKRMLYKEFEESL